MAPDRKIKLSVILISYNEAEYLSEAVESCLKQSLDSMEIIIGDDGSSDGSLDIIEKYEQNYPGRVRHFVMERPAKGTDIIPSFRVSGIIKKGMSIAKGQYLCILSGDDFFCDGDKFKDAVSYLDRHHDYAAFVSGYKRTYPDGTHEDYRQPYPPEIFWGGVYLHISSFVFRRDVYEKGLLLERFCDDTGLIYSIACSGKWKYTDKITFAYRQRDRSIIHSADTLELDVLELMIFQDILCKCDGKHQRKLLWESYARFAKPMKSAKRQRKNLKGQKKYLNACNQYNHNICKMLALYDSDRKSRREVNRLLMKAVFFHLWFRVVRKIYSFKLNRKKSN